MTNSRLHVISPALNSLCDEIVNGVFAVHKSPGPGLLERVYQTRLAHELQLRRLKVETEVPVNFTFKQLQVNDAYRLDMLINDQVIIELKAVESLLPVHTAQLLSYMKLTGKTLGYLINLNVPLNKRRYSSSAPSLFSSTSADNITISVIFSLHCSASPLLRGGFRFKDLTPIQRVV